MVATISPQIVTEVGGSALIAWLTALYEVGSISAGAGAALLVLRLGLRRALLIAASVYFAGCVVSGIGETMAVVLTGRLLQGCGGGALVAISLIAIWRLFPERLLSRVIAVISAVWGVAAFVGPLFGALLATYWGWRAAFFAFAVQALMFGIAVWRSLPDQAEMPQPTKSGFPAMRILLVAFSVVAFAGSGIVTRLPFAAMLVAIGAAALTAFFVLDNAAGNDRLFPRGAGVPSQPAGATMLMVFALSAGTIAFMVYAPVFIAARLGLSPIAIGAILMLESIGWSLASILVSGIDRRSEPLVLMLGFCWVVLSIAGFAYAVPYGSVLALSVCAFGQGAGFGMAWTFVYRRSAEIVAGDDRERMTAALSTIQRLGYALGAAYVGFIANRSGFVEADLAKEGPAIAQTLFLYSLIPAAAGLAAAWRFIGFQRVAD